MKIIIYGANETGSMLATEFFEDHDIVVIDPDPSALESFKRLDIATMKGEGSSIETLKEVGVAQADLFIASSGHDEANIVACIMAKHLKVPQVACFVSCKEHLDSLRYVRNEVSNANSLHFDTVIWPEILLQEEIYRIVTVPDAIRVEIFAQGKARLLEYRIKECSQLVNKAIKDCDFPEEVLVVGIVRNEELYIPSGDMTFGLNDKVIFMGTPDGLHTASGRFFTECGNTKQVAVIGGGSVGYELSKSLSKSGIRTKIVEKDYARCQFLAENVKGALVLNGDGTDIELLKQESIPDCSVAVCVTDNDEKNLLCSLLLKQLGINRVVVRVSRPSTAALFERVGVDVAISPKEAAVHEIKNRLVEPQMGILATVERGLGEIVEVSVPESYDDKQVMDLKLPKKAVLAIIQRGSRVIIPKGHTLIRANDILIIFTMHENAADIKDYFSK